MHIGNQNMTCEVTRDDSYDIKLTLKKDRCSWQATIRQHISLMIDKHHGTRRDCKGIDVRVSAPFVKSELQACDTLLEIYRDEDIVGFAFIKTNTYPCCLHVSLMTSFVKGVGTFILTFLQNQYKSCSKKYITLQSTDAALDFYLKFGFSLFNQMTLDTYIQGGDVKMTQRLRSDLIRCKDGNECSKKYIQDIKRELLFRHWINPEQEEWPLLMKRTRDSSDSSCRRSPRLSN